MLCKASSAMCVPRIESTAENGRERHARTYVVVHVADVEFEVLPSEYLEYSTLSLDEPKSGVYERCGGVERCCMIKCRRGGLKGSRAQAAGI